MRSQHIVIPEVKQSLIENDLKRLSETCLIKRVYGSNKKTLLHLAAKYSSELSIFMYCVYTLNIKVKKATFRSKSLPIHLYCKYVKLEASQLLFSLYKPCIEKKNNLGETPLSIACKYNHTDLAVFLIQNNSNINNVDNQGWTPIH